MNTLARKVAALLPLLEARGEVYFFALGERKDVNRWDVILSAQWSDTNYTSAVRFVADALTPTLEKAELALLSGVVIMPSTGHDIQTMPEFWEDIKPEDEKIVEVPLDDWDVRRLYVFRARHPRLIERPVDAVTTDALQPS